MKILTIINKQENEPKDYTTRLTVKALVLDEDEKIAIFSGFLLGGGVEEGETTEQALHRECMEEAGIEIEIVRHLGVVTSYRDEIKRKYEVHGFLARLVGKHDLPTTKQEDELGETVTWLPFKEARSMFEKRISELEASSGADITKDSHQGKLYNTETALTFLNEATK